MFLHPPHHHHFHPPMDGSSGAQGQGHKMVNIDVIRKTIDPKNMPIPNMNTISYIHVDQKF